jgi:hypothetical protein
MIEGTDCLLHGSQSVGTVSVNDVDVSEAHALKRCFETLDNVLAAETVVVDENLTIDGTPVDL